VVFVSSGRRALELAPTVIYVDLDRCPSPAEFRLDGAHVVGFAAHVDDERLEAGRAAGFDDVVPRSVFFRRLRDVVDHDDSQGTTKGDQQ
jgi:hypothetical protein